jgi:hypothetical protein
MLIEGPEWDLEKIAADNLPDAEGPLRDALASILEARRIFSK